MPVRRFDEVQLGDELPARSFPLTRLDLVRYAGASGDFNVIHWNQRIATSVGLPDVIAPPTFAIIVAQRAEAAVVHDPEAGIDYSRVVHGEQRFTHLRPIVAGDRLVGTPHVDSVREAGGHGMVTTRVEIATEAGEHVATAFSTIVVRGGE